MREACIICPANNNSGFPIPAVRDKAVAAMCTLFGGCTVRSATGSWFDESKATVQTEPVYELSVAAAWNATQEDEFRRIAQQIGHDARQQSVYLRYGNGDVAIIETAHLWNGEQTLRDALVAA